MKDIESLQLSDQKNDKLIDEELFVVKWRFKQCCAYELCFEHYDLTHQKVLKEKLHLYRIEQSLLLVEKIEEFKKFLTENNAKQNKNQSMIAQKIPDTSKSDLDDNF